MLEIGQQNSMRCKNMTLTVTFDKLKHLTADVRHTHRAVEAHPKPPAPAPAPPLIL